MPSVSNDSRIRDKVTNILNEGRRYEEAADFVDVMYFGRSGEEPRMALISGIIVRAAAEGWADRAKALACRFPRDLNDVARRKLNLPSARD